MENVKTATSAAAAPLAFLPTGGKRSIYACCGCARDITTNLRIRCAECPVAVDLCSDCFCVGVTNLSVQCDHKASHSYRVVDCVDIPSVFNQDWTMAEELLLFEGYIIKYLISNISLSLNHLL